jgi:uridine kinase
MPDNRLVAPLPAANLLMMEIRARRGRVPHPFTVAIDGRSGSGKSTVAGQVARGLHAALVSTDDFFAAGITDEGWNGRSAEQRAADAVDWRRLRAEALEPLRGERSALWHAFDFAAGRRPDGTYGLRAEPTKVPANQIIILDGAYSSRPELADLLDYTVLVETAEPTRQARLAARENADFLTAWYLRWEGAEEHYFTQVRPTAAFHLVVNNKDRKG